MGKRKIPWLDKKTFADGANFTRQEKILGTAAVCAFLAIVGFVLFVAFA